jgi:hypothetical protein
MDWRYNTIWFDQIDREKIFHFNYKDKKYQDKITNDKEYGMTFHFKHKGLSFESFPDLPHLLFLEMDWANILNFEGIDKIKKLKRLELHYCIKLENDKGLASLKDSLEFLHINQSKKFSATEELLQLTNLRVLCLNTCGPIASLDFLKHFPNLIDFRFVDTKVLSGDLTPILNHPTIRTVGFMNKKHYNFSDKEIKEKLDVKSDSFKEFVYKDEYLTYKYKYRDDK